MRLTLGLALALTASLSLSTAWGQQFSTRVSMQEKSAATFYVPGEIAGYGSVELMVDTGSGYMTINEHTLEVLKRRGSARYVKQLRGVLADGAEMVVPVYAIARMSIGCNCWLHDVEAAVFPGKSRQILGLSALRKASPFIFSVDPPALQLSGCDNPPAAETREPPARAALTAPSRD
jgi:predicted aspartyl protease